MSRKIKNLVVDTTAFIKAANLQDVADNIYTIQEVIDEITSDRQRRKLVVLPYDLQVKDVFTENIKFVTDFSKKTGDYTSLSATDIKVIALTYQLEKEKNGTDHLKTEPTMQKTVKVTGLSKFLDQKSGSVSSDSDINTQSIQKQTESLSTNINDVEADNTESTKDITNHLQNINFNECKEIDNIIVKVADEDVNNSDDNSSADDEDSDDGDWITPSNLIEKKKEMELGDFDDEVESVEVACITSDFAMQNVLKQIGLSVTSIDGRIIRHLRTFIFRCTTCFQTTSVMTKLFCPKCGHSTLKKVSVSIDDDGNQHIHINGRKPLTAKGKKFSLPTPRGGQHFQYPILTEDQHIHKNFATKLGRSKTNALDPDYIAGFSPFAMKDVNSKSAVLGVRADKQDIKYWMKHYSKGKK